MTTLTNVKSEQYKTLLKQLDLLLVNSVDEIANSANFCALIKQTFDFHWVGIYRVFEQELILGTFQGPVACVRIPFGQGVCGDAWQQERTLIVDNVNEYPGHIACSASSQSEIVVPIFRSQKLSDSLDDKRNRSVIAVLDIDADTLSAFDSIDKYYLEKSVEILSNYL